MHVEDFGKMKSADIEVALMTLFVGDNNSGKSYIMTLIYGLFNTNFFSDQYQFPEESENFTECQKFFDKLIRKDNYANKSFAGINMDKDEIKAFESMVNEILALNKDTIVKNVFNRKMHIGSVKIRFKKDNVYVYRCRSFTASENTEFIVDSLKTRGKWVTEMLRSQDERNRGHIWCIPEVGT